MCIKSRKGIFLFIQVNVRNLFCNLIKLKDLFGLRSKWFIIQKTNLIIEDCLQNILLISCCICAFLFAQKFHASNYIIRKLTTSITSENRNTHLKNKLDTSEFHIFAETLQYTLYIFNNVSGSIYLFICTLWCFTTRGDRKFWTNCRFLVCSISIIGIFITIVCFLFTIQVENLVKLKFSNDNFAMQNDKVQEYANLAMKIAINGSLLSAISFVLVYLIYSISGGIYAGVTLYLITHVKNETQIKSTVTSWILTLTIVQSIISLHPTIIWSQRSASKSEYLGLSVINWFMPIVFHQITSFIVFIINKYCCNCTRESGSCDAENQSRLHKSRKGTTKSILILYFFAFIRVSVFAGFIVSFTFLTKLIVAKDIDDKHDFIKSYVYTCIITIFTWTASCTYYILYLSYFKCVSSVIRCTCNINPRTLSYHQMELISTLNSIKKVQISPTKHKVSSKPVPTERLSNRCIYIIKYVFIHLFNFLFEQIEYNKPSEYGWRIRLRRIYLWIGTICFTFVAANNFQSTIQFSSKAEIQK